MSFRCPGFLDLRNSVPLFERRLPLPACLREPFLLQSVCATQRPPAAKLRPSYPLQPLIVDPWFYLAASVAVLVVGVAKGGLGGGIGVIAVPLMAMVISPVQAAAILLPILMVMDALALRAYWRLWDRRYLRVLVPASLAGTVLGFLTARSISPDGLRLLVAAVALAYAAVDVRRRARTAGGPNPAAAALWGATSGFTSFSIHAGGPPLQAYLLPRCADRTTFQATSVVFFFIVNWSKVLPYAWLGQWSSGTLLTSLALLPLAPVGVAAGRRLHRFVSDETFFRVVRAALLVIAVKLVYDVWAAWQ